FAVYNKAFHEGFYNSCGNAYLVDQILLVRKRTNPYRLRQANYAERIVVSWNEHDELLAAVMARDVDKAKKLAIDHIFSGGRSDSELVVDSPRKLAGEISAAPGVTIRQGLECQRACQV